MYSFSEIVFFLLFFATLLLLLIFGETTIGIPLLGVAVLLCLIFASNLQLKQRATLLFPVGMLGVFTLVTIFSIFTSIAIPLSVNNAVFYVASFVVFLFFMYRKMSWLSNQLVLGGVVVLITLLSVLTIVYTSFTHLATHLPSLSVLTAQNGHNQSIFLFILLLPVFWYFAEKYRTKWLKLALIILLLGVITTFSRLGIFLSTIELWILWKTTQSHQLKTLGKYGTVIFCCLGVVLFVLSTQFSPTHCPLPIFQDKLCKPLHTELRPAYWLQGWRAFLARPVQGWGGGTFTVLSPLFQGKSGQFSGFVHNEYLQAFTEYGVLGGFIFLSFAVSVWLLILKETKTRKNRLHFCVAIGVGSVLFASMFDFGLHLIGIWLIFLVVLTCWLREASADHFFFPQRFKQFFQISVVVEFLIGSLLTLVWSLAFLTSSLLWNLHQIDTALYIFPFTYGKVEEALFQGGIRSETRNFLLSLYQNQYQFLDMAAAAPSTPPSEKMILLQRAVELDPLYESRRYTYLRSAYQAENWEEFELALSEWKDSLTQKESSDLSYDEQKKILEMTLDVANKNLDDHFQRSVQLYQVVYELQPWVFAVQPIEIFNQLGQHPPEQTLQFIEKLDQKYLWPYSAKIYGWELSVFQTAIEKKDFRLAEVYLQNILQLGDSYHWQVAQVIEHDISTKKSLPENSGDWAGYQKLIQTWEDQNAEKATFDYNSKLFVTKKLRERNQ